MFKNFYKSVFRSVWKNRSVSLINILGLSVGMTAAVFILLWVQNELSYDLNQPNGQQIYRVTNHLTVSKGDTWVWESSPFPLADFAKKEIPGVEKSARIAPIAWNPPILQVNNIQSAEKKCAYVDSGWMEMFHYDFIEGDKESFNKNPFSLVLTSSKAKKYFGKHSAIGQMIRIDTLNYQVRGVIKDNLVNSSFPFDVLIPLSAKFSNPEVWKNENDWGNFNYLTFLQLRNGVNPEVVAKKLDAIVKDNKKKSTIFESLIALPDLHFETGLQSSDIEHTDRKVVYIFSVLAGLLLVIACINYVNLTTARASLRAKEVSVRKIVGAGRIQLFVQFIAESLLISSIALVITLLLVEIGLPLFNQLSEKEFLLPIGSPNLWKVLIGTLLAAAILNGIYPALLLSSFKPMNVFRGISILTVKDASFRKCLVVFQFSIAVLLVVGTLVIFRQLQFIQQTNTAYQRSQVFQISIPSKIFEKMDYNDQKMLAFTSTIRNELSAQPSIQEMSQANQSIVDIGGSSSGNFDWDGRDKDFNPTFTQLRADANFQKMFGLQLLAGRWFTKDSKADANNYILNETAVNTLQLHKPWIGQRFVAGGDTGHIIGVVKDFHYRSMHEKIGILLIKNDPAGGSFFIKTYPGTARKTLAATEKVWNKFISTDPFSYTFLDESFEKLYKSDRKAAWLIFIFSLIAILISALGLFALAAFTADQRNKEIGIRKVLGASLVNIVTLLSKDFIRLVGISILIAIPIGWWAMNKWLQDFAYRIHISWWIFGVAGLLACLIALIAVSFHALKAAVANPVHALRSE